MTRMVLGACVVVATVLIGGRLPAQDQPKPPEPPSVSAVVVCSCRCLTKQAEVHDLELPADGACKVYNNLDCRSTTDQNGVYSDCKRTGVPVQ